MKECADALCRSWPFGMVVEIKFGGNRRKRRFTGDRKGTVCVSQLCPGLDLHVFVFLSLIPPVQGMYEYIIFQASEVKDFSVESAPIRSFHAVLGASLSVWSLFLKHIFFVRGVDEYPPHPNSCCVVPIVCMLPRHLLKPLNVR